MTTGEAAIPEPEVALTSVQADVYARFDAIAAMPDYRDQWGNLQAMEYWADRTPDMAEACLDYAARPGSSLLMRSYALDIGISAAHRAVVLASKGGEPATPSQVRICEQVREVAPNFFGPGRPQLNFVPFETPDLADDYFYFFRRLAHEEGVNSSLITPYGSYMGYDPTTVATNLPEAPCLLLGRLIDSTQHIDINNLPPNLARDALELALDFRGAAYREAVLDGKYGMVAEFAQLWRLSDVGGWEHDQPIDGLYGLPDEKKLEYARTFNRLYAVQAKLEDFFPDVEVADAARALIANALFAVEHHMRNGMRSEDTLELRRGTVASVSFTGDQPIQLLQKLIDKIERGHARLMDPNTQVMQAVDESDFTIFDFQLPGSDDPLLLAHYVRPQGTNNCNYRYEYGGRNPGVMASMDWRFDEGATDSSRPYHKGSRTDESFSIRLDRDVSHVKPNGFHDPAHEDGVLSLDVGSLMGTGFGRDIALLLGFGNKLRSAKIGQPAGYNHQTTRIDQRHATATAFARVADTRREELRAAVRESEDRVRREAAVIISFAVS